MNDQIMFKDLENGIYIMKDTRVVEAAGFPDNIKLFGRLVLNGGYLISYIKDIDSNDRYAEFNHKNMKIKYTVKGCVKLMLMDLHINKKKDFEDTIIKHLKLKNKRCVNILLNNGLNDRDVKFLKYLPDRIYRIVDNNLKYNNLVSIEMYIENNELRYSYTTSRHIDRSKYDIMSSSYATDVIYYTISKFLKEYATMGVELAPFRAQTDSARCTMMDEIKNLDAKTLYPKTTNIGGKSIYDEKIVDAYNQFLNIMFDKEKYNGISIRVPNDYDDDWFEVLPDFRYVRNLACKITPELDLYINIKTLDNNGNYVVDISDTDYTFTSNNINGKCIFSEFDRVLTISIIDLQTRLLDILQDSKSNMVDSNVKIKVDNELDNEIKDIDSKISKNEANDITMPVGQGMNNLLRGLPFNHIDNFDLEGDSITYELNNKNKFSGLKQLNHTDLSDWVNNNSGNFDKNFKHINLDGMDTGFSSYSLLKRLPNPTKYGVNDMVYASELNVLNILYNRYIVNSDDITSDYLNKLNEKYNQMFKHHIEIGVLYPKLKFNYQYGYYLNSNYTIEYGIIRAVVVPFDSMISNGPIDIYKDIEYKYDVFVSTQYNLCHTQNNVTGVKLLDIYQADKCKKIYRTIFSKYIELGVLKKELELIKTGVGDDYYEFSTVDGLYN